MIVRHVEGVRARTAAELLEPGKGRRATAARVLRAGVEGPRRVGVEAGQDVVAPVGRDQRVDVVEGSGDAQFGPREAVVGPEPGEGREDAGGGAVGAVVNGVGAGLAVDHTLERDGGPAAEVEGEHVVPGTALEGGDRRIDANVERIDVAPALEHVHFGEGDGTAAVGVGLRGIEVPGARRVLTRERVVGRTDAAAQRLGTRPDQVVAAGAEGAGVRRDVGDRPRVAVVVAGQRVGSGAADERHLVVERPGVVEGEAVVGAAKVDGDVPRRAGPEDERLVSGGVGVEVDRTGQTAAAQVVTQDEVARPRRRLPPDQRKRVGGTVAGERHLAGRGVQPADDDGRHRAAFQHLQSEPGPIPRRHVGHRYALAPAQPRPLQLL